MRLLFDFLNEVNACETLKPFIPLTLRLPRSGSQSRYEVL